VADAEEDRAEEHEQAAIGAEAAAHGLRVHAGVGDEILKKTLDAEVFGVEAVADGQQGLVLRVEDKDEAKDDAEHAAIEVVAGGVEGGAQPVDSGRALGRAGRRSQTHRAGILDGLGDLCGELLGDVRLAASALAQQTPSRVCSAAAP
jgi:hypothetical protein